MIVDSQIRALSMPKRFVAYAHAYRDSAEQMCQRMLSDESAKTWPNAAVVLMLSAHAVELFLKGAILSRDATADIEHHRISDLVVTYASLFPEAAPSWEAPMQTRYVGFAPDEIVALRKSTPVPRILYRYPAGKGGSEWSGIFGFGPCSFSQLLHGMLRDF